MKVNTESMLDTKMKKKERGERDQNAKHYANQLEKKIRHEMEILNPFRSLLLLPVQTQAH